MKYKKTTDKYGGLIRRFGAIEIEEMLYEVLKKKKNGATIPELNKSTNIDRKILLKYLERLKNKGQIYKIDLHSIYLWKVKNAY